MMSRRDFKGSLPDLLEVSDVKDRSVEEDDARTSSHPSPSTLSSNFVKQNYQPIPKKIFISPLKRRLKIKKADEMGIKLSEIKQEKSRLFRQSAKDPDAQFLMSLLPYLKKIPKYRNLYVRSKLLDVLIKEQNIT